MNTFMIILIVISLLWIASSTLYFVIKYLEFRDIDPKEYDVNIHGLSGMLRIMFLAPVIVVITLALIPLTVIHVAFKKHK